METGGSDRLWAILLPYWSSSLCHSYNDAVLLLVHHQTQLSCACQALLGSSRHHVGGPRSLVPQAMFACKALGGAMLQSGILAAAGGLAQANMVGQLEEDCQLDC